MSAGWSSAGEPLENRWIGAARTRLFYYFFSLRPVDFVLMNCGLDFVCIAVDRDGWYSVQTTASIGSAAVAVVVAVAVAVAVAAVAAVVAAAAAAAVEVGVARAGW